MTLPWLDRVGDWNPQLFRELKGRLNVRNIAIAVGTSLLGQFLLILYWLSQLPNESYPMWGEYCNLRLTYNSAQQQSYQLQEQYRQLQAQFSRFSGAEQYDPVKIQQLKEKIASVKERLAELQKLMSNSFCSADAIDIQGWWHDYYPKMFVSLSLCVLFTLLVIGSYMLISDLAREERRGTLNFIRLSPQSTQTILSGKVLGVPFLVYLGAILTLPLHLWLGVTAQISVVEILSFWAVLIASCAFFYSAALLFGLASAGLGGFQPWFGSGAVLFALVVANFKSIDHSPADWLNLFSPSVLLPYLVNRTGSYYTEFPFSQGAIQDWQWFYFPLGATGIGVALFVLLNYGIGTYWIGQALNRRFRNPNATMLSKQQSYWLVGCSAVATLGFALQSPRQGYSSQYLHNLHALLLVNLLLFVGLIAALSPQRQALQDWARYRRERRSARRGFWSSSLVQDLIWGEKSPALVAVTLNLAIASAGIVGWILLWDVKFESKLEAFTALILSLNIILVYATLTQLMLLMKTKKRSLWTVGTVVTAILLPPFILNMFSLYPGQNGGGLWLFTAIPWIAVHQASVTLVFQVLFVQWGLLGLLNLLLTRKLRQAGESASKALLAGRSSVDV